MWWMAMGAVCRRSRTKVQIRQVRVGPRLAGKARSVGGGQRQTTSLRLWERRGKLAALVAQARAADGRRRNGPAAARWMMDRQSD
jgi:hypothetical protein